MVAMLGKVLRYLRLYAVLSWIMTLKLCLFAMSSSADVHGNPVVDTGGPMFPLTVAVLGIYLSLLWGCKRPANPSRAKAG